VEPVREELYLEAIQRDILRMKKWRRFEQEFKVDGRKVKHPKPLPVRFVIYIPGNRQGNHTIMACLDDEIQVSMMLYPLLDRRMTRIFLSHELVHHFLRLNGLEYRDGHCEFESALCSIGVDYEFQFGLKYRKKGEREWLMQ
jgi:uncharacterized protein YjaZ